jgi:glutamine synthetase adenylyltransferase
MESQRFLVKRAPYLTNGGGGIREIEHFVQALQLIHAGTRSGRCATGSRANAARAATGSREISRSAWVAS